MATRVGRRLFIDTNVLLGATDRARNSHDNALQLLSAAADRGLHLFVNGQVVREYLVVATRPIAQNGLGLSPMLALENAGMLARHVVLLEETLEVAGTLQTLVAEHSLKGKRIHDANVVATMTCHAIEILVTDNRSDFDAFENITVISVADAAAARQD